MNDYYTQEGRIEDSIINKEDVVSSIAAQVANLLAKQDNWEVIGLDSLLQGCKSNISFSVEFLRKSATLKSKVKIVIPRSYSDEDEDETQVNEPAVFGEGDIP